MGSVGLRSLLGTFLMQNCAVCRRATAQSFCLDCYRRIEVECFTAKQKSKSFEQLIVDNGLAIGALGQYQGTLKQAILALKYENCPEVARLLGAALAKNWQSQIDQWQNKRSQSLYVVPIPLHANRLAQRGYNQAALIARSFCQTSGLGLAEQALLRREDTKPQYQLGAKARQENLASAFEISTAWRRKQAARGKISILLIDDIYTTGATARSAATVLRSSGCSVVGVLALASAKSS